MKKLTRNPKGRSHFSTDIPTGYNTTRIRVLHCSPTLLYIYWELPHDVPSSNTPLSVEISSYNEEADTTTLLATIPILPDTKSLYHQLATPERQIECRIVKTEQPSQAICSTKNSEMQTRELPEDFSPEPLSECLTCTVVTGKKMPTPALQQTTKGESGTNVPSEDVTASHVPPAAPKTFHSSWGIRPQS